jgi:hypothetical protein
MKSNGRRSNQKASKISGPFESAERFSVRAVERALPHFVRRNADISREINARVLSPASNKIA